MLHEGLFDTLYDVQCFDLAAVASYRVDADHRSMSASLYANPDRWDANAHRLDAMILGAAEVDLDFNVNVTAVGAVGLSVAPAVTPTPPQEPSLRLSPLACARRVTQRS